MKAQQQFQILRRNPGFDLEHMEMRQRLKCTTISVFTPGFGLDTSHAGAKKWNGGVC